MNLTSTDLDRVLKAIDLDDAWDAEWARRHGKGEFDFSNVEEMVDQWKNHPAHLDKVLESLSTQSLKELQALTLAGREMLNGPDSGRFTELAKSDRWDRAFEYFGNLNGDDREAFKGYIGDKSGALKEYLQNAMKNMDVPLCG